MAKIPTILEPGRADGKLATSGAIFDENKGMFQSEINDIQDTLNSDNPNKPLSANQGKILKDLLDSKVIEAGSVPIDTEPIEGNITHLVNSDGLAKEFNKYNTEIIRGSVYDVSAHNNRAVFESLSTLLSNSNLSTLIPTSVRHGGMSIRFIQGSVPSSNNKYVQYRLMAQTFSTNKKDWQGVDDEPTAVSNNLVKSRGVQKQDFINFALNSCEVENVAYSVNSGSISNGVIQNNKYSYSSPIFLEAGKTIVFCVVPGNTDVLSKTNESGTSYSTLIRESNEEPINTFREYKYTTEENCYVAVCWYSDVADVQYIVIGHNDVYDKYSIIQSANRNGYYKNIDELSDILENKKLDISNGSVSAINGIITTTDLIPIDGGLSLIKPYSYINDIGVIICYYNAVSSYDRNPTYLGYSNGDGITTVLYDKFIDVGNIAKSHFPTATHIKVSFIPSIVGAYYPFTPENLRKLKSSYNFITYSRNGIVSDIREKRLISINNVFAHNAYIRPDDGKDISNVQYKSSDMIKVNTGDIIRYKLYAQSDYPSISFYSHPFASAFVNSISVGTDTEEKSVSIVSDGYIRVCCKKSEIPNSFIYFPESIDRSIDNLTAEKEELRVNVSECISKVGLISAPAFNIKDYSTICVHHDNFYRDETGYVMGANSISGTENSYTPITGVSSDDGMRVSIANGAVWETNNDNVPRTVMWALRKVNASHNKNWMIETSFPSEGRYVKFVIRYTDNKNFTYVNFYYSGDRCSIYVRNVVNGAYGDVIYSSGYIFKINGEIVRLCFVDGFLHTYVDDALIDSGYIGNTDDYVYLSAYKSEYVQFKFLNIFNITTITDFNPNYLLDKNLPNSFTNVIITSANEGEYELQNVVTHFSDYADKFSLTSTSPKIHSGRRSERGIGLLQKYRTNPINNLLTRQFDFDVYFPSSSQFDDEGDIIFQLHDRDGAYRAYVPFFLAESNGVLSVSLSYTLIPGAVVDDVIKLGSTPIWNIETDSWHHITVLIRERYEENQHPYTEVRIDGNIVFVSHNPNCFNDLVSTELQYGIYKNKWGAGVTTRERYYDNMKVKYL